MYGTLKRFHYLPSSEISNFLPLFINNGLYAEKEVGMREKRIFLADEGANIFHGIIYYSLLKV